MRLFRFALPGLLAAATITSAHDIITTKLTYTREVSRILAARCLSCHASHDSVPLTNYQQVRPWAVSIKEQVLSRAMPPWGVVKGFGDLDPAMALNQEEMTILAAWVIGGAPEGNPALLASAPSQSAGRASPGVRDSLEVQTSIRLSNKIIVAGIKPLNQRAVDSAQVTATLPGGEVVPLVWLYRFQPGPARSIPFRKPVVLPAGTTIRSSTPLPFVLQSPPADRFTKSGPES